MICKPRHRGGGGDANGARGRGPALAEDFLGLVDGIENAAGMGQKVQAILGESEAAGGALDQPHLEMCFECCDLARDGRLRRSYLSRDGREGSGLSHANETPKTG